MVSEDRVRAVFDAVKAKLETLPRDAKTASAGMARLELLVASGALGWVLGGTGERLRAGLAIHGIELPEAAAVPVGEWSATPPTVPGWYWFRWKTPDHLRPLPWEVYVGGDGALVARCGPNWLEVAESGGRWWSIPIQPPGA